MMKKLKVTARIILLILIPLIAILISLFIGRYHVSVQEVIQTVAVALGINKGSASEEVFSVVVYLRLPRVIAAAAVGVGLSVSGASYQGVFKNPLVNSGLLGVSSGAGFGAALAIVLFKNMESTYFLAFAFGILAVVFSYWIARIYKTVPTIMLILGGTIVSSIFSALTTLLKYLADIESELPAIVYWLMGSVSSVSYEDFWALIPIFAGMAVMFLYAWKMNVLSMGDKEARSMGVDVFKSKLVIVIAATLSTAGAVCLAGVVGWIGLVIPHMGRMIVGNDNRKLLPVSASIGAVFMVVIDTISRSISTSEIPLGVLTAIVGAPFFIVLLKKTKGGGWNAS